MRQTVLNEEELNKRANEVFDLQEYDYVYNISVNDYGEMIVEIEELGHHGDAFVFEWTTDMSERPQALEYLLGTRDDFND